GCHDERATEHGSHAGSKSCLDCHAPHAPASLALNACPSCHSQAATSPQPAAHVGHGAAANETAPCIGCHRPPAFVAGGEGGCRRCHGAKPTLAAAIAPPHAVCTSCHTPHAPAQAAASCTGCHASEHVAHADKDACVNCHAPHGPDPNAV